MHHDSLALGATYSATKWTKEAMFNYVKLLLIIAFHFQNKSLSFSALPHNLYSKNTTISAQRIYS